VKGSISRTGVVACAIVVIMLSAARPASAVLPRPILKSYFERGDKPTESQFGSLIDSFIHQTDDGLLLNAIGGTRHSGTGPNGQGLRISATGVGINEGLPASLGGEWLPAALHPEMEPLWAGQSGFLPLKYTNSTGTEAHYGFLQITMSPVPAPSGLTADALDAPDLLVVDPPAIFVEYWAWETTPNTTVTTFLVPEPAAGLAILACAAAALLRRRKAM
jgi:hypothetical protein